MTSTIPETTPLQDAVGTGQSSGRARVSRQLALLIAAGAVVVLALGWALDGLGQLAPAAHFANGQTQQAGLYRVALAFAPAQPQAGAIEQFTLRVTDTSGRVVSGADVHLSLAMPSMDMTPIQLTAVADGTGGYRVAGAFPMRGEWIITVHLTPPGGSAVHTDFDLAVR